MGESANTAADLDDVLVEADLKDGNDRKRPEATTLFPGGESTGYDPLYLCFRDGGQKSAKSRQLLDAEWARFRHLADSNFRDQFRRDFTSRAWEMRIGCLLLDQQKRPTSANAGPDFKVVEEDLVTWVECVAPTPGKAPNTAALAPDNEFFAYDETTTLLRYSSALVDKHEKWNDYLQAGRTSEDDAFVVALSGAKIRDAADFDDPDVPWLVRMLYGVGRSYVKFDAPGEGETEDGHHWRPSIAKASGNDVPTALFVGEHWKAISAVIFSAVGVRYRAEHCRRGSDEDVVFVHNPCAAVPLPRGWLKAGREFYVDDGDHVICRKWSST